MPQPIFYFDKLNSWDKTSIKIYVVATAIVSYFFFYKNGNSANRDLLLFYTIGTHFFLYLINYKSLRNLTVYLTWVFIALVHLYFYFQLRGNPALQYAHGHATTGLRNTIIVLMLYQVLRLISLKTQKLDIVAPARGSWTDYFEERKLTVIDYLLFVVYFATTIIISV